jgi:hypothetical protein
MEQSLIGFCAYQMLKEETDEKLRKFGNRHETKNPQNQSF